MLRKALFIGAASYLLLSGAATAQESAIERGPTLFQRQCGACHQVAQPRNAVGPTLQGVIGRAAGAVQGFNYSPALKNSGITWTPDTLGTYLANPTAMVRGTRMVQRVTDEQQRKDIIEFLAAP
jgi:cytochrome c